jgi:hypothetical protein
VKSFFARAKALLPCIALGLAMAQTGSAESTGIVISNYSTLNAAVSQGGTSIFSSNATVTLSGGAEILQVATAVVLDGSTNSGGSTNTATITRASGSGPIFYILKGGSLTLVNLTISGGFNTTGGAIFNDTGGTLIIRNCVFTGNTATNLSGADGSSGSSQGSSNGGNGGDGLSASGGAIFSQGTLEVFFSIFNNNTVTAGNGGNGGNGAPNGFFGGNAGNGGNGGSAQGGAIVCNGGTNIFVATDFTGNKCTAGNGGTAGSPANGAFPGNAGSGGIGGSSLGGAVLAAGRVCMTNCLFSGNTVAAGSTSSFNLAGGAASGGGLDLASSANAAFIENTTFYQNSCQGGAGGGNSSLDFKPAGNGGAAVGGGLASAAALTVLRNCTLATNELTGGVAGVSATSQSNGLTGLTLGFDLARTAGSLKIANTLLFGGSNSIATNLTTTTLTTYVTNTQPNDSGGVTDLGYNFSSDTSVVLLRALGSIENEDPFIDTGLSSPGNTAVGLDNGFPGSTLAVLIGSPAIGVIPGIPGISFPAYDQVYQPRSTPTTIGAYEANPLDLTTATPAGISAQPSDVTARAGAMARFQVGTSNNPAPLGYQWQFNGTNLIEGGRITGAWSNILTINPVSIADTGSYSVLVGASTLSNLFVSSQTNILTVFVPVTIQVEPPRTVKPAPGKPLNLSVTATGAAPLTFQWFLNQTIPLSDGPEITGSTNATLTIYPLAPDNAGNYSVVVSNPYGSVTSSLVTLSIPLPTLTILPTLLNVAAPTLMVQGTAAGEFGVTNIQYQLNGGAWNSADISNQTNWSAPLVLQAGTNIFSAYSVDLIGQPSHTNRVTIFYVTNSTLTLTTSGFGKITSAFTGDNLVVGRNYTVTAAPNPGNLFSNWTGAITATNNPLTFLLESNTALQANFVANFFLPAAGIYNGLFSSANGVAEESAGMLYNLVLNTNGAYSGKLFLAGTSYTLAGNFDILGHAAAGVGPAGAPGGPLQVDLTLDNAQAGQIAGTVSNTLWTANLRAGLAVSSLPPAQYTLLFSPPANPAASTPPGTGYALVTNHAGTVALSGALADGTTYGQTVSVTADGDVPIYASLYQNTGLLLGWINLNNLAGSPSTNFLTWIKKPSRAAALYSGGFTNVLPVQGAPWAIPPANTPAIPFNNGLLVISNSGLSLIFNVALSNNNALAKLGGQPANSLTGSINPKTGLLSVTFGNGNGQAATTGAGAVLQTSDSAAGFFVTTAGAGLISLQTNLSAVAPILFQQPASQNYVPNSNVQFSVRAIGSLPLSYQWIMDGTNLADGGPVSGAAASQLSVNGEALADAGSYCVVVSNAYGSATSSVVTLAVPPPTLIIKPLLASVTTPTLTVEGTAAGKFGVASVQYQLNGGTWTSANTTTQWSNWSAPVILQAGTNVFSAYSVDPIGNDSQTQTAFIFYATQSALTLQTSGSGTITRAFTSNNLVVGRNYTLTAVPNPGNLFSNWTGTMTTTSNPLTFLMVSNLTLTANFVTNFFLPATGAYNGLFSTAGGVTEESAGMLYNLILKTNGAYSGKLFIAGTNYAFTGSFDIFGHSALSLGPSNAAGGPLLLDLTLDQVPKNQIVGTVSNNLWAANLVSDLAANTLPPAEYTVLLSALSALTNTPPGEGYALITNHAGMVALNGALADGTTFSQAVPASAFGNVPVYASLYQNTGLLFGWINLNNLQAAPPVNLLTWIKKPSGATVFYPAGFTNLLAGQGALWTAPAANTPAITFPKGDLLISNASLHLDFKVAVLSDNTLAKLGGDPTNSLTGSIVASTGQLKLSFGNGNGAATTPGLGAVLQTSNTAAGFFITSTNAGALFLAP